jgi:sialic acid synthase SpsE
MVPSLTPEKARSLDPDDLRTAVQAFDSAVATLGGGSSAPHEVRYELARFIIERSLDGERDTERLHAGAVEYARLSARKIA